MKLVVFRSTGAGEGKKPEGKYLQEFDTRFADRVLGNLRSGKRFCTACGPDCNNCRARYDLDFSAGIAAVLEFPSVLPYVIEQPAEYVPRDVPRNDVILAVCIHEQILLEILKVCREWGTGGVIVPLEEPDWISAAARSLAHEICDGNGLEISFPKPFCAFAPPAGGVLARFRETFHIGRPDVDLAVQDRTIETAHVNVSAACGATYCVARWLEGRSLDENLEIEVVSKWWHAYPCTASMERDPELDDETPLHVAGQAHYAILSSHKDKVAGLESPLVTSPLGKLVQKPVPPQENLRNIDKARTFILDELQKRGPLFLSQIRKAPGISPAAINTALLNLKKDGLIKTHQGQIRLSHAS